VTTRHVPNLGALLSAADLLSWCFSKEGAYWLRRWGPKRAQRVLDETVRPIMELEPATPLVGSILARAFRGRFAGGRRVA